MSSNDKDTTNLEFPCDFHIKIIAESENIIEASLPIIQKHAKDSYSEEIKIKPSKNGKYTSITIKIYAKSKEQLDNIYRALSKEPKIIMVL